MKEIIITPKRIKTEIRELIACFFAAFMLNVFAIIYYETSWSELYTQWIWVLIITCGIYALTVAFRVVAYLFKKAFKSS